MNKYYLSADTIFASFDLLKNLSLRNENVLFTFFILKACGFDNKSYGPVINIATKGRIPAFMLGSLFGPEEPVSQKYNFMNPFLMNSWSKNPSESLEKWVGGRIKNNVIGGATTWRKFILIDPNDDTGSPKIRFSYNYLNEIKNMTLGDNNKINLFAFAIWAFKFSPFEQGLSVGQLVEKTKIFFKLTEEETSLLFERKTHLDITYKNKCFDTQQLRKLIGNPPGEIDWVKPTKSSEMQHKNIIENQRGFKMANTLNPNYVQSLLSSNYQMILTGPPGTGKSHICDLLGGYKKKKRIQFHPDYSYQQFIGGYVVDGDKVEYKLGQLMEILQELESMDKDEKYLLIIEEINRANTSQVFGEMVQILDRNYSTSISMGKTAREFNLPKNLHILGTMNSSDRTIGSIDLAVRRRFLQLHCPPNPEILMDLCGPVEDLSLTDFLIKLNKNLVSVLKNKEFQIGHAFFLQDCLKQKGKYNVTFESLEIIFNHKILPIIEEFCYGDYTQLTSILGDKLPERPTEIRFKESILEFMD
jgi:5-methylcytosine-specific restriction enzyme B